MGAKSAKSAVRAFEVLELFSDSTEPLAVSDIARILDYPASSTSVLLKELCRLGYLMQEPATRHYSLAARIAMANVRLNRQHEYEQRLACLADSVHALTGEEVIIAVEHGIEVQYVHLRKATLPFLSCHRAGALRPICRTSMGKMLLAQKHENEIGKLVRRVNASGDASLIPLPELLSEVEAARDLRVATAFEEATPGAAGLATLLPVRDGQPKMVLAICGMAERIRQRKDDLAALLHRAVEAAQAGRMAL